ncbi:MAG: hypothetical protein GF311_27905, partial [Candidatus Lokiarchaeota archaeon]|nr:hypothetical protein [Candidatus Lokiarchaeota archaeon]
MGKKSMSKQKSEPKKLNKILRDTTGIEISRKQTRVEPEFDNRIEWRLYEKHKEKLRIQRALKEEEEKTMEQRREQQKQEGKRKQKIHNLYISHFHTLIIENTSLYDAFKFRQFDTLVDLAEFWYIDTKIWITGERPYKTLLRNFEIPEDLIKQFGKLFQKILWDYNQRILYQSEQEPEEETFSFGLYRPKLEKILNYKIREKSVRDILHIGSYPTIFHALENCVGYEYLLEQYEISPEQIAQLDTLLYNYEQEVGTQLNFTDRETYYSIRIALSSFFRFLDDFRARYNLASEDVKSSVSSALREVGDAIHDIFIVADNNTPFQRIIPVIQRLSQLRRNADKIFGSLEYTHKEQDQIFNPLQRVRSQYMSTNYNDIIQICLENAGIDEEKRNEIISIFTGLADTYQGRDLKERFGAELSDYEISDTQAKTLLIQLNAFDELDSLVNIEEIEYAHRRALHEFMVAHPDITEILGYSPEIDLFMFTRRRKGFTHLLCEWDRSSSNVGKKLVAFANEILHDRANTELNIAKIRNERGITEKKQKQNSLPSFITKAFTGLAFSSPLLYALCYYLVLGNVGEFINPYVLVFFFTSSLFTLFVSNYGFTFNKRLSRRYLYSFSVVFCINFIIGVVDLIIGLYACVCIATFLSQIYLFLYSRTQKTLREKSPIEFLHKFTILSFSIITLVIIGILSFLGERYVNAPIPSIVVVFGIFVVGYQTLKYRSVIKTARYRLLYYTISIFVLTMGLYCLLTYVYTLYVLGIMSVFTILTLILYKKSDALAKLKIRLPIYYHGTKGSLLVCSYLILTIFGVSLFFFNPPMIWLPLVLMVGPSIYLVKDLRRSSVRKIKRRRRTKYYSRSVRRGMQCESIPISERAIQQPIKGVYQASALVILVVLVIFPLLFSTQSLVSFECPEVEFSSIDRQTRLSTSHINYSSLQYNKFENMDPLSINDLFVSRAMIDDLGLTQAARMFFKLYPQDDVKDTDGRYKKDSYSIVSDYIVGPADETDLLTKIPLNTLKLLPGTYDIRAYYSVLNWFNWYTSAPREYELTLTKDDPNVQGIPQLNREGINFGAVYTIDNGEYWTVIYNGILQNSAGEPLPNKQITLYLERHNSWEELITLITDENGAFYYETKIFGSFEVNALSKITWIGNGLYKEMEVVEYAGLESSVDGERYFPDNNDDSLPDWPYTIYDLLSEMQTSNGGGQQPDPVLQFEVGEVDLDTTIDSGFTAFIDFENSYIDPIVVAFIQTRGGSQSIQLRAKDVTSDNCTLFMQEYDSQGHNLESASYIVIEAGSWELPIGDPIEAGYVYTDSVHSHEGNFGGADVQFSSNFGEEPLILHMLNTYNANTHKYSIVHDVTSSSFTTQQAAKTSSTTISEKIGWIALPAHLGSIEGILYEAGRENDGTADGVSDSEHTIIYEQSFSQTPIIIASQSSCWDDQNHSSYARSSGTQSATQHGIYAEEDDSGETNHDDEQFSYWVFSEPFSYVWKPDLAFYAEFNESSGSDTYDSVENFLGTLAGNTTWTEGRHGSAVDFDGQSTVEEGTSSGFQMEFKQIELTNSIDQGYSYHYEFDYTYDDPICIGYIITNNEDESIDVRFDNVTSSSCDIFMEEAPDGAVSYSAGHASETVAILVVEAGQYTLPDGTKIEAGKISTSKHYKKSSSDQWETITYATSFSATPVVLHSLGTYNNGEFKSTNAKDVTSSSFKVTQMTAETNTATATEEIHWVAIEGGKTGSIGGIQYETHVGADDSDNSGMSDNGYTITYSNTYSSAPIIISKATRIDGGDGLWSKGHGTHTNSQHITAACEDQDADSERGHTSEAFSSFIIESNLSYSDSSYEYSYFDYINYGDILDDAFSETSQFVATVWINPSEFSSNESQNGVQNVVLSKQNMLEIGVNESGYLHVWINTQEGSSVATYGKENAIKTNQWQFIAVRYDSGNVDAYLNDQWYYSAIGETAEPWENCTLTTSGSNMTIGAELNTYSCFTGAVDEVSIYRRAVNDFVIEQQKGYDILTINAEVLREDGQGDWIPLLTSGEVLEGELLLRSSVLSENIEIKYMNLYLSSNPPNMSDPNEENWTLLTEYTYTDEQYNLPLNSFDIPDNESWYFIVKASDIEDYVVFDTYTISNEKIYFGIDHFDTAVSYTYIDSTGKINHNSQIGLTPLEDFVYHIDTLDLYVGLTNESNFDKLNSEPLFYQEIEDNYNLIPLDLLNGWTDNRSLGPEEYNVSFNVELHLSYY